jgi:hypothetical protein
VPAGSVSEEQILEALRLLPPDRWGEVLELIDFLRHPEGEGMALPTPIRTGHDLAQSQLVGIWADRSDLGPTQTFARQLRERAERRGGTENDAGH